MHVSSVLATTSRLLLGIWMTAVIVATFAWVPPIQGLGNVGRIFIFHVPTAWIAVLAFTVGTLCSGLYLWRQNPRFDAHAVAAAEAGTLFTLLATVTGMIFSQAVWGIFWNWDPRQTSIFVLLLIYAAYFALRSSLEDPERRRRLSAIYALVSFVPMLFLFFVAPRVAESTLHPNCALIPGSKCEGIMLGGDVRVGLLGDTGRTVELIETRREGQVLTALVELREPGMQATQTYTLMVDATTGQVPAGVEIDQAQPRIGDSLYRLRIDRVSGEQFHLTIRSPGDSRLLSGLSATTLTFVAALLGFTGLYAWIQLLRASLLTLEERIRREELLAP